MLDEPGYPWIQNVMSVILQHCAVSSDVLIFIPVPKQYVLSLHTRDSYALSNRYDVFIALVIVLYLFMTYRAQ